MDSEVNICLSRAEHELRLGKALFRISQDEALKDAVGALKEDTFFSAVISHAYYGIFYAAKALLLAKGVKTGPPSIHQRTYDEFKIHFIDSGLLDARLLEIYNKALFIADELLGLYKTEKAKRAKFTYKTLPQANQEPAQESMANASKFIGHIRIMIGGREDKGGEEK